MTFVVQQETMKAHAAILCARSEVFERELNAGLKESKSKEIWQRSRKRSRNRSRCKWTTKWI